MKKPGTTTRPRGTVRCAIYTRKSSEEGLEQEFNSLQAQREACEAFIDSQRHEGWLCLRAAYDDGGFSGATMDRPALQQLLADITAGRVDTGGVFCVCDTAVQHDDLDGTLDPQRSAVFRAVRARGHRGAHPRQDRRLETEGDVDGWRTAARVWSAGSQARHDRQRGGNRSLDFPPLCRTRLSPLVKGGARSAGGLRHRRRVAPIRQGPLQRLPAVVVVRAVVCLPVARGVCPDRTNPIKQIRLKRVHAR